MKGDDGRLDWRTKAKFRLDCWRDRFHCLFRFLRRLPGYWRLNRIHDLNPDFYGWVMNQYSTVMNELTGGKLCKPSHDAMVVIDEIWEYMYRHFAGWKDE